MSAAVLPLRPRAAGDAERLWGEYCRSRDDLIAEIENGKANMDTVCRCADAYRAWCRAYAWDRIA